MVVLMISRLDSSGTNIMTSNVWNNNIHVKVKKCKSDMMKTYDHHDSMGSCFSFRNKLMYSIMNNSSAGVYNNKRNKNEDKH